MDLLADEGRNETALEDEISLSRRNSARGEDSSWGCSGIICVAVVPPALNVLL